MSTLQLGLAILGGVVLAIVVAYNAWNNHRHAPKRAQGGDDPLSVSPIAPPLPEDESRWEPSLDVAPPPANASLYGLHAVAEDGPDERALFAEAGSAPVSDPIGHAGTPATRPAAHAPTPVSAPVPAPAPTPAAAPSLERRTQPETQLDSHMDVMASLLVEHLVSGDAALVAMPPTRRVGSKPFAIEGYNATSKHWEYPQAGQRYMAFQAGVQLANRSGALNQIEFSEFVMKTQAFADALNAAPEFPDMQHEVARARDLDQFASAHDAQLSFTLRARQAAWSPGYVQQCATRLGFTPGSIPGRLVLHSSTPGQPPLLVLSFDSHAALADDPELSALCEVELALDVPQVHRSEQPFARLCEVATALCKAMDGVLCDQNGLPLPAMAMESIVTDLEQLYNELDAQSLSAGSVLARRLFS